jgi:hypothetical protein
MVVRVDLGDPEVERDFVHERRVGERRANTPEIGGCANTSR